jgi:hypothetical protein
MKPRHETGFIAPGQAWRTTDPDALDDLMRLRQDLASPPMTCGWRDLVDLWAYDHYRLICTKPDALEDFPELPVRLRGAFGRALHALPERRTTTGRGIPHVYDVLFAPLAFRDVGLEAPRPIVVRARVEGLHLMVDLHVFGDAMAWGQDAALAMTLALGQGIALSSRSRVRGAIAVEDIVTRRVHAADPPEFANYAGLSFFSPVMIRLGERMNTDPRAILRSAVRRVQSMARWHGVAVAPPDEAMLMEIGRLSCDDGDLRRYVWSRHSQRQGDTPIPMRGLIGKLVVRGPMSSIIPALALAETCNTGSHAALGLGWFDLTTV